MKTILLIEDNQEMRENTAEILELAQYKVIMAENGKAGIEKAMQLKPDLIICDIMMPELDGYGVLFSISKNPDTAAIPFIFLTAKAERTDFRKGMELGADDYLTKPFDDVELMNAVESRLRKSERIQKHHPRNLDELDEFLSEARDISDIEKLSEEREMKTVRKKDFVYYEGNRPTGVYFVNKGRVKTVLSNEEGKEFITGIFKAGDFFGHIPLIQEARYTDSAVALEESEVVLIPKDDFFKLLYQHREISKKFIQMLSGNIAEKENQLLNLAYNSVRKRVADGIINLYEQHGQDVDGKTVISISRENLANLVGTSRETLIRTLSDFKDEKLVELKGDKVTILNPDKLERMKN